MRRMSNETKYQLISKHILHVRAEEAPNYFDQIPSASFFIECAIFSWILWDRIMCFETTQGSYLP